MARALLAGLGVLAVLVLPACTNEVDGATPGAAGPPATSPTAAGAKPEPPTEPMPVPTYSASASWDPMPGLEQDPAFPGGVVDEDTGQTIQVQPVPTWDDTSRTEAVAAAEAAMTAFARPDLDQSAWWAGVEPLLAPRAAENYAYADPATVPARHLTGPGTLVEDTSAYLVSAYVASVEVPTDVGPYLVVLSRTDATSPWLVERLSPPDEVG